VVLTGEARQSRAMTDITLRQLRYLAAVARTLNFRRAAEACGVSQPSLSQQLQNLEAALGERLVERGAGTVAMTPVGREVAARATAILDAVQSLRDVTGTDGLKGTLRLGVKPTLGPYLLPHVVKRLHEEHASLGLLVREGAPAALERELREGIHDVLLVQLPATSSEVATVRLFREPLFLAVAADHPLAGRETFDLSDLKGLPVLSLGAGYHLHEQVVSICEAHGARLLRDYEGTSLDALRQMVAMGMGVTFLPALYVASEVRDEGDVDVLRPKRAITRSIGLAWRKSAGEPPAFAALAEQIRSTVRERFPTLTAER
jgi:LysR family hydrogen peroxide-inducible transcriptional activator